MITQSQRTSTCSRGHAVLAGGSTILHGAASWWLKSAATDLDGPSGTRYVIGRLRRFDVFRCAVFSPEIQRAVLSCFSIACMSQMHPSVIFHRMELGNKIKKCRKHGSVMHKSAVILSTVSIS